MATNNIPFPVNLRQNQNSYSNAYGKYYAEPDTKEPLNLKGFAKHISDHGKLVTYQEKIPVSSYAAATAQPDNGGDGNG